MVIEIVFTPIDSNTKYSKNFIKEIDEFVYLNRSRH